MESGIRSGGAGTSGTRVLLPLRSCCARLSLRLAAGADRLPQPLLELFPGRRQVQSDLRQAVPRQVEPQELTRRTTLNRGDLSLYSFQGINKRLQ